ncbi:hypothetical protein QBC44DRAFT_118609 [Cladorrhinum sp. PSN332]|nr:hypothetical protein QBC44DRAFT_118609 [Cladorrhinum sp. PSN332]
MSTTTTEFVLSRDTIHLCTATINPPAPIYHIRREISSLTHKDTSIQFFRGDGKDEGDKSRLHLFNLVHPVNARYRTDIPAEWYLTCSSSSTPSSDAAGNIRLQISKSLFGRIKEIKALRCVDRDETSKPLFDAESEKAVFTGKQRFGGGWVWSDEEGREVAKEDGGSKLVVKGIVERDFDALVAVWVLRLWFGVAEEKKFEREAQMELLRDTGEESLVNMRWAKKAGIAGLAGAGGGR